MTTTGKDQLELEDERVQRKIDWIEFYYTILPLYYARSWSCQREYCADKEAVAAAALASTPADDVVI